MGATITLVRYDDYWGEPAQLDEIIFTVIPDGPAAARRSRRATSTGTTWSTRPTPTRSRRGFQIMRRPAFNVGYVGFQQNHPPFENINIRKAIAHAINKENLIQTNYPEGTEIATQFMPPELFVGPTT